MPQRSNLKSILGSLGLVYFPLPIRRTHSLPPHTQLPQTLRINPQNTFIKELLNLLVLLLEGSLQGLHLHLLLAQPGVQRRALRFGLRAHLGDLLVGSAVGFEEKGTVVTSLGAGRSTAAQR